MMTTLVTDPQKAQENTEQLTNRLFGSLAGFFDVMTIHIGHQLGFYKALTRHGPMTFNELAEKTGTFPRYVQEWLEQQAVAGLLFVDDETAPAAQRRFGLPPGFETVLADPDSLNYMAPLAQLAVGVTQPVDDVVEAYRAGKGVPYERYGFHLRRGQGDLNRPMLLKQLAGEWIPAMEDVHRRLSQPGARVADIGCGVGFSSIGLAQGYPHVQVDGFDLDYQSIEDARRYAQEYGVADRVRFYHCDAADSPVNTSYDLVLAVECIHDMSNPVSVLATMKKMAGDTGAVLVIDEKVHSVFTVQNREDTLEWFMYGCSVLHCLPAGMAEQPSAQTGTVMRTERFSAYALEAGFNRVEVLPIDHTLFRFYRLYQR